MKPTLIDTECWLWWHLAIEHAHALRVARLPAHHNDPFDRLLIAQAQLERCAFLTADAQLVDYDVDFVWAGRAARPRPRRRRDRRSPG